MKILISAFACDPRRGSEPGAGWNWVCAASEENEVWVITRTGSRGAIQKALRAEPRPSLRFVYVDVVNWKPYWKTGGLLLRAYYHWWQVLAARKARSLHEEIRFDVVHHVTFANLWLPALAWAADAPFVLGPVGGGARAPVRLYPVLGLGGSLREITRTLGQELSRLNPIVRCGWRRAAIILAQNEETRQCLPREYRRKTIVRHHASLADDPLSTPPPPPPRATPSNQRLAVYAGRLLPLKGVALAIDAISELPHWRLQVVGSGPDAARLRRRAHAKSVSNRVDFIPWAPRDQLWSLLRAADVVVVPSLRDESPMIVAEATWLQRPVAAFDQGGPRVFSHLPGTHVELAKLYGARESATELAAAIERASAVSHAINAKGFSREAIVADLSRIYQFARKNPGRRSAAHSQSTASDRDGITERGDGA